MSDNKLLEGWQFIKLKDYSQKPEYGFTASATDKVV